MATVLEALPRDWGGILLMVTNPVDVLCTWAHFHLGLERSRLLGYMLNDSLRLRTGIAGATGRPQERVEAWVLGEYGDLCVPLLDRIRIDGAPAALDPKEQAAAFAFLRTWYERPVALDSGRTSTWTTGLGSRGSWLRSPRRTTGPGPPRWCSTASTASTAPASPWPVSLGRRGVTRIHEWPLTEAQRTALHEVAASIRAAARGVKSQMLPVGAAD